MKKLLSAAVAAVFFVGSMYAIDLSVDANFALPYNFTSSTSNGSISGLGSGTIHSTTTEFGLGGDLGLKAMLTKTFGLKVDLGLYFPQSSTSKGKITTSSILGTSTNTFGPSKTNYSDSYDSFTSFNIFVGPAIRFKKTKTYDLCVTPGISVDMRKSRVGSGDSASYNNWTYLGFGADLDARYSINKNLYLNASCPVIYQFKIIDKNQKEYEAKGLYVIPKIGVGYRL